MGSASMMYNTLFFLESGFQLILKHPSWYLRIQEPVLGSSSALQHFKSFSSQRGLFHSNRQTLQFLLWHKLFQGADWPYVAFWGTRCASVLFGRGQKTTTGAGGHSTKQFPEIQRRWSCAMRCTSKLQWATPAAGFKTKGSPWEATTWQIQV